MSGDDTLELGTEGLGRFYLLVFEYQTKKECLYKSSEAGSDSLYSGTPPEYDPLE